MTLSHTPRSPLCPRISPAPTRRTSPPCCPRRCSPAPWMRPGPCDDLDAEKRRFFLDRLLHWPLLKAYAQPEGTPHLVNGGGGASGAAGGLSPPVFTSVFFCTYHSSPVFSPQITKPSLCPSNTQRLRCGSKCEETTQGIGPAAQAPGAPPPPAAP